MPDVIDQEAIAQRVDAERARLRAAAGLVQLQQQFKRPEERPFTAAERNKVELLCGQTYSMSPDIQAMWRVAASGELGRLIARLIGQGLDPHAAEGRPREPGATVSYDGAGGSAVTGKTGAGRRSDGRGVGGAGAVVGSDPAGVFRQDRGEPADKIELVGPAVLLADPDLHEAGHVSGQGGHGR